ncbi:MAG TPA: metallopeptidase family protein [Candidatus Saccharimonadales bacterium]|nr:metallopeptidase family protein [Candidatus Saccharimonadales bacterium]
MHITDQEFEKIIADAMDALPERFGERMNNVAVVYADDPTPEQRKKLQLRGYQTLFGLYEGIPLTQRGIAYNMVLPDKITLFKNPIAAVSHDMASLRDQVKHTLWHEVAHHFGLDHERIHELDEKRERQNGH